MAVILSWSGGKDSALALYTLREQGTAVAGLLTTVTEEYERISMHGVRRELLRVQAEAVGLPLIEVRIPPNCSNQEYEARMGRTVQELREQGIDRFAFGDLFLEDIRQYREEQLSRVGAEAVFPLWGADTADLAERFVGLGFRAILVTVDPRRLDPSFCGRDFDEELLGDLRRLGSVDPMGENGEFHTFVHDGPIFRHPVEMRRGSVVERDGFYFCDLLPDEAGWRSWDAR